MTNEHRPTVSPQTTWIVLPAFNEAPALPQLFHRITAALEPAGLAFIVIVVDDGSTDGTAEVLERFSNDARIRVIRHPHNLGLGATIRDGLREAARLADEEDVIVTLDADSTQPPELIPAMLTLSNSGIDVVIASRYLPDSRVVGVSAYRRMLSFAASLLVRTLFPIRGVRDYTCGFRAYRASVLERFVNHPRFFDQSGFQVMLDILLKLRLDPSLSFAEVPLTLRYDLKSGASKMNVPKTILASLSLLVRRRFGRVGPTGLP